MVPSFHLFLGGNAVVKRKTIYVDEVTGRIIGPTTNRTFSSRIREICLRYQAICHSQMASIRLSFTPSEYSLLLSLIRQFNSETILDGLLYVHIESYPEEKFQDLGVEKGSFLSKLDNLTLLDWISLYEVKKKGMKNIMKTT
jgi:hypothetical protein